MKKGLGKGLGALIQTPIEKSMEASPLQEIDISLIEPNPMQPRKSFPEEPLEELAQSIQEFGIVQPIVVNENNGVYTIIAGERRYRAAHIVELKTIPCIIKTYSEMEALQVALIENVQRQDLNPIEEAMCYHQLGEYFFFNREEIGKKVGKSRNTISARMNLLNLDQDVQKHIISGELSASHGAKLVGLPIDHQIEICEKIITQNLGIREIEALVSKTQQSEQSTNPKKTQNKIYTNAEIDLKEYLGANVNIKGKEDKGKIEIEYSSKEELSRIIGIIRG
ncbi:MAG: ParB/RepB/Spo0J family partition protein [Defluviitaleaceae bacterium]|nr:ParB/RepB/Spo0J family partition protein [Defluviitaleaceae bacterium]